MSGCSPLMRRYCCITAEVPGRSGEGLRLSLMVPEVTNLWRSIDSPLPALALAGMFQHDAPRCKGRGKWRPMTTQRRGKGARMPDQRTVSHRERLMYELRS